MFPFFLNYYGNHDENQKMTIPNTPRLVPKILSGKVLHLKTRAASLKYKSRLRTEKKNHSNINFLVTLLRILSPLFYDSRAFNIRNATGPTVFKFRAMYAKRVHHQWNHNATLLGTQANSNNSTPCLLAYRSIFYVIKLPKCVY